MKRLIIIVSFLFLIAGCGYSTKSLLPSDQRNIYVEPFVNKIDLTSETTQSSAYRIYRPLLESDITKEVIDRFIYDGNLKITSLDQADLILSGQLINYNRQPLRYSDDDDAEEYRLNIIVNIKLTNAKNDTLSWAENNFIGDTTYFTTGSLAKTEATAIEEALKDLARRIVERTTEGW